MALNPESPYGGSFAFNLSCFLGEEDAARLEAGELAKLFRPQDPRVLEVQSILREWAKTRSESELQRQRGMVGRLADRIPEIARVLCQAFAT